MAYWLASIVFQLTVFGRVKLTIFFADSYNSHARRLLKVMVTNKEKPHFSGLN